jgi:hypothetical protein
MADQFTTTKNFGAEKVTNADERKPGQSKRRAKAADSVSDEGVTNSVGGVSVSNESATTKAL